MIYIDVKQAATRWGISERRVRLLCQQAKIAGVVKKGRSYQIPINTVKPADNRHLRHKVINDNYTETFLRIEALKAELSRKRPFTQGELARLQEEFLVEFTYNSNAIEGNTLTLQETALVLEGITIDQKPLKDHLEAVGHRDAFLYIQHLVTGKVAISERIIKEIHSLVLINRPDDKGVYRRIPVRIIGAENQPPQPYLIPAQMEQLIASQKGNRRHSIENAALFHLDFEGIHPFVDGNGRTGRLILNLMLMQQGYPPINVKFTDRKRYYANFGKYFNNQHAEPMVLMIAQYLEDQLKRYLQIL